MLWSWPGPVKLARWATRSSFARLPRNIKLRVWSDIKKLVDECWTVGGKTRKGERVQLTNRVSRSSISGQTAAVCIIAGLWFRNPFNYSSQLNYRWRGNRLDPHAAHRTLLSSFFRAKQESKKKTLFYHWCLNLAHPRPVFRSKLENFEGSGQASADMIARKVGIVNPHCPESKSAHRSRIDYFVCARIKSCYLFRFC